MHKKLLLSSIFIILALAVFSFLFIKLNNNHLECESKVEQSKDQQGNTIVLKKHICKENYSF
jgi:large-conductance mechanosensitive channel